MAQVPYVRQSSYEDQIIEGSSRELKVRNSNTPVGTHLDTEFNAVKASIDNIFVNAGLIQRSDGALANRVVGLDSLSEAVLTFLGSDVNPRGAWVTLTVYAVGDIVEQSSKVYYCLVGHVAGVFATDYAAAKWMLWSGNLDSALLKDGSVVPTADLPMGGQKHTGVGNAAARNQYAAAGQVQDSAFLWAGSAGGTGDVLTASLTPAITAYTAGLAVRLRATAANTVAPTLAINGLSAIEIRKYDRQVLTANDIKINSVLSLVHDGTYFIMNGGAAAPKATDVAFTPSGGISASEVGSALTELDSEKMPKAGGTFTGDVIMSAGSLFLAKGTDVASAATLVPTTDGNLYHVTGTTGITAIDSTAPSPLILVFDGAVLITNAATLILPGAANITTAAGDVAIFEKDGTNWRCVSYTKANGSQVKAPANTPVQVVYTQTSTVDTSGSVSIPFDGTIPQVGEGYEVTALNTSFTAKFANSKLLIEAIVFVGIATTAGQTAIALFKDGAADAIAVGGIRMADSTAFYPCQVSTQINASDLSSHSYTLRIGNGSAQVARINSSGAAAGNQYGATVNSWLKITELAQ